MRSTRFCSIVLGGGLACAAIMLPGTSQSANGGGGGAENTDQYTCHGGYLYLISGSTGFMQLTGEPCGDENTVIIRSSVKQVVGLVSKQAGGAFKRNKNKQTARLGGSLTGSSAGDMGSDKGLWANYDYLRADDLQAKSDTDMNSFTIGGDLLIGDNLAVGLSASYQMINEDFGGGTDNDTRSLTVAPYLALMVTDFLTMDFVAGYSWLNEEDSKAATANVDFDTTRYFLSTNTTFFSTVGDKSDISASVGYLFSKDAVDANANNGNIDDDISFAQIHANMEFGYFMTDTVEPYFNFEYEEDLVYEANPLTYDSSGFSAGGGIRVDIPYSLLADVHVNKVLARDKFRQFAIMANLRHTF